MATLAEQGAGPGVAPLVVAASRAVAGLCLITAAVPASGGLLLPGFVAVPAAAVPPGGMAVQLSASLRAVDLAPVVMPAWWRPFAQGQAVPATQPVPPGVTGYDPTFNGHVQFDPADGRALLDKFGYLDRDGDGFREQPNGRHWSSG